MADPCTQLRRCFFAILLACSGLPQAHADALEELNTLLQRNDRVHARFEQTVRDEDGRLLQESSGELWAARPDRFRWESAEPFAQVIVSDGQTLWIHDADLEQVSVRKLDRKLANTPALLLSGHPERIASAFRVVAVPLPQQAADAPDAAPGELRLFDLQPLDDEAPFAMLRVEFSGPKLVGMRLNDNLGQYTRIRFEHLPADTMPIEQRFHFELPPGADVIYQ